MPGLVGLITKMPREDAEAELLRMVEALCHEASYVTGTWSEESLGLYVGWIAHNDPSAKCMPFFTAERDVALVFSGDDFPEPSVMARLTRQGHKAKAEGSSYLVYLAEDDSSFPKCLNGLFHGVLADRRDGKVVLFNDRYGMHRLYYHQAKEAFYFAAEAKGILAVRPELKTVDYDGLAQFISCGCTLENRTLFKGMSVLPPASTWTFHAGSITDKGAYFGAQEWEEQTPLEPESYYRGLRETFSKNLPRYFEGSERIGISLTGGLDSRMIMSWCRAAPGTLPCYSFGGMFRDSQDVKIARKVSQLCGQSHEVISVGHEFLTKFPYYSERAVFLTDGCVEVKHAPDLYVSERAAQIAPTRITGNYGGEVFRHVRAFKPVDPIPGLFTPDFSGYLEKARDTYLKLAQGRPLSFAVFRQAPWYHYGLLALERSQLKVRSPFLDNDIVRTAFRFPQAGLENNDVSLRLIADGNRDLGRIRTDRGFGGRLPGWAAAMQQAYFAFTFKAEYAYDYGMPQSVVRVDHALAWLHLERLFLGRHKFNHFRVWYRDALGNYLRGMLLDSRTLARPYLQPDVVENLVQEHIAGRRNFTSAIHKILTLEHFHRLFIDSL